MLAGVVIAMPAPPGRLVWLRQAGLAGQIAGMRILGRVLHRRYSALYHLRNTQERIVADSQMLDVSMHERRRARRMDDPEYRLAYERAARELAQTDAVIQELDSLRIDLGISKAELARRVNRNASSVRRLFTASRARPEFPLIAALADALGADLRVVRRAPDKRPGLRDRGTTGRAAAIS
jgi:ribosome-binding protein aMBF1 (putative translation factor)